MKKVILFLVFVNFASHGYSQPEKGKLVIDLNGMYSKTWNEYGTYNNGYESLAKSTDIGGRIGIIFQDNFMLGIGMDYTKINEKLLYREIRLWNINNEWILRAYFDTNDKITRSLSPYVYFGYYIQVAGRLYTQAHASIKYSTIKDKVKYFNAFAHSFPESDPNTTIPPISESTYEYEYWFASAHLNFSLVYYLNSHIGLYLELGGMEYAISEWDLDRTLWNINFNPVNWKVGLQFCF